MPAAGFNNETAMLMDAIQSLQALHKKSRVQNYAFDNYASDGSGASSSTPNKFNGSSEHRRKIRELTIALEAQAIDETRHFALQSPMTRKEVKTPRVSPAPGTAGQIQGLSTTAKTFLNDVAAASLSSSITSHANPRLPPRHVANPVDEKMKYEEEECIKEICVEENKFPESTKSPEPAKSLSLNEQRKRMESLTRELDAQFNAAMQAQAFYKANPHAAPTPKHFNTTKDAKSPKNVEVAPAETLSTELDTTVASSSKRGLVSASTSGSEGGQNGIILLDNKEDFEDEHTHFKSPLSPNSFFVNSASHPKRTSKKPPHEPPKKLQHPKRSDEQIGSKNEATPKKTNTHSQQDAISRQPSGTIEMIKKIMVWDVSSEEEEEEEEESIPQGRLYNDTFEDELSSKYSTSFESAQSAAIKQNRRKSVELIQKQQYVIVGKSSSIESEGSLSYESSYYTRSTAGERTDGSLSYQTSFTDGRTDGSLSDTESQSFYTTDGSYDDTLSASSTVSSLMGRKGIPLM